MNGIKPGALALDVLTSPIRAVQWLWRWCGYMAETGPTGNLMVDDATVAARRQRRQDDADRRREERRRRLYGLDKDGNDR
jgi:hypothetical protein